MTSNAIGRESASCKDKVIKVAQAHPHYQRPQSFLFDEKHDLHDYPEALVISSFGKLAHERSRCSECDMDFAEGKHITKCYGERNPADGYDEVERWHCD